MKVTNERLEEICSAMVADNLYDYAEVFDTIKHGEIYAMAKELRQLREAFSNPVAFYGDTDAYYNTAKAAMKDGCETIDPLFTKPEGI